MNDHTRVTKIINFIILFVMLFSALTFGNISANFGDPIENPLTLNDASEVVQKAVKTQTTNNEYTPTLSTKNQDDLYSITLDNHNGTETRIVFTSAIKYKTNNTIKFKNDKLKKINKLYSTYAFENRDNNIDVYFPKKIKDGVLMKNESYRIRLRPITNKNTKAIKKAAVFHNNIEEVVEYPNVFGEDTALQYKALIDGIKENIVLEKYTGQNIFQFYIDLNNLEPLMMDDGSIVLLDSKTKNPVTVMMPPDARDSFSGEYSENDCHYISSNQLTLVKKKNGYVLSMIIDKEFLENKNTIYPVVIDPSMTMTGVSSIEDTTIYSNSNNIYTMHPIVNVGYQDAHLGEARALYKFNNMNVFDDVISENIIDAKLKLYEQSGKTNRSIIRLYQINQYWEENTVNWKNCPDFGPFICDNIINESLCMYEFSVRSLFQFWLDSYHGNSGNRSIYSFILTAWTAYPEALPGTRSFASSQYLFEQKPSLVVTYAVSEELQNGVYYIKNKQSNKYLDILGQDTESGTNVHQWEFHGGYSQQWSIEKRANGYYTIHPMSAPSRSLNVANNYTANGSNVQIYGNYFSGDSAQWKIIYNSYGDNTYRLMNRASNDTKALVVLDASSDNGANVIQYDYSILGNRNDDWVLERADVSLPTPMCFQLKDKWCWVACAEMLARTNLLSSSRSQIDAVEKVTGTTQDQSGTVYDSEIAAEYISWGYDYYATHEGIYTPDILTRLIRNGCPVLISRINLNAELGHTIVAYGFYYDSTNTLWVRIKDPHGELRQMTYTQLKNDGTYKWDGIVVRNIYKASETICP